MPAALLQDRQLGTAVVAALTLHLFVIFGIGFKLQPPPETSSAVEITLVREKSREAPEESSHIARDNQIGSGDLREERQLATDRAPVLESAELRETDIPVPATSQVTASDNADRERLVTSQSQESAGISGERDKREEPALESPPPRHAVEIAGLRAKLRRQRQAHSELPHTLVLTSTSARAADEAQYLRQWIEWVEKIGNENYPEEASRKRIFGAIRLAVTLDRDGSVAAVEIIDSSGQRVLDQAAVRIVRLAAPFEPIPPSIRDDRIEVIRTWNFIPGNRFAVE